MSDRWVVALTEMTIGLFISFVRFVISLFNKPKVKQAEDKDL